MKNARVAMGLLVFLGAVSSVHADVYVESKAVAGGITKTWISGLKKREEVTLPVIGRRVTLYRVDRGAVYIVAPELKEFQRITIEPSSIPEEEEPEKDAKCTPQVKILPNKKKIAGFNATGYQTGCTEKPTEGVTIWMAPAGAVATAVSRESKGFGLAYAKARYRGDPNFSKMFSATGVPDDLKKSRFGPLLKAIPQNGFMVAIDVFKGNDTLRMAEVQKVSTAPVKSSLFTVPGGYARVARFGSFDTVWRELSGMAKALEEDPDLKKLKDMMSAESSSSPVILH